jgi:hypothetical protein
MDQGAAALRGGSEMRWTGDFAPLTLTSSTGEQIETPVKTRVRFDHDGHAWGFTIEFGDVVWSSLPAVARLEVDGRATGGGSFIPYSVLRVATYSDPTRQHQVQVKLVSVDGSIEMASAPLGIQPAPDEVVKRLGGPNAAPAMVGL